MGAEHFDPLEDGWWADKQEIGEMLQYQRKIVLGISQEKMAEQLGVDQSQISKYERGKHTRLSPPKIEAVAIAYYLNRQQTAQLFEGWTGVQPQTKSGGADEFEIKSLPEVLTDIDNKLARNQQAIDDGGPKGVSLYLADELLPQLDKYMERVARELPKEIWPVQERLTIATFQYGETLTYWQTPSQVFPHLQVVAYQLYRISKQSDQALPKVLAYYARASAAHIKGDDAICGKFASRAVALAGSFPDLELDLLTLVSSSQAKLKNKQARETAGIIERKIDKGGLSDISLRVGFHAIARVESVLHSAKAWKQKFEAAKSEIGTSGGGYKDPYTGLLLISGAIKAMKDLNQGDETELAGLVKEAVILAGERQARLKLEIEESAEQVRNFFENRRKNIRR